MLRYFVCIILAVLLTGCSNNFTVPVSMDYDVNQPYIEVKSYAWLEQQQYSTSDSTLSSPMFNSGIMLARVRAAVDKELASYGINKVNQASQPDIMVSIRLSTEDKVDFDSFHDFYGYYPFFSNSLEEERFYRHMHARRSLGYGSRTYVAGTLVVDFVNPKTKTLICRASSQRSVSHLTTPESRSAFINETVAAIVKRFADIREQSRLKELQKKP